MRPRFTAELLDQTDPEIGQELIRVRYEDGRTDELRLHEYARMYAIPGLYEQVVHDRLGCRSPAQIAAMLGGAVDRIGWDRGSARVLDVAAGNGISGEALKRERLAPVIGSDIVPEARVAALRDRPDVYDDYITLDLLDVTPERRNALLQRKLNVLSCVAPVGTTHEQLPPEALTAAAQLLAPDALIAYIHDPQVEREDPITVELWAHANSDAELLERTRYLHRFTVTGQPYEMDGMVWRIRRRG